MLPEPFPPKFACLMSGGRNRTGEAEELGEPPSPDQLIAHERSMVG